MFRIFNRIQCSHLLPGLPKLPANASKRSRRLFPLIFGLSLVGGLIGCGGAARAQYRSEGKVIYERRTNQSAICIDLFGNEKRLSDVAGFLTVDFQLVFKGNRARYTAVSKRRPAGALVPYCGAYAYDGDSNVLWKSNLIDGSNRWSVRGSAPAIRWTLREDHAKINGFDCRRAIGKLFDTLTVVAFFAEALVSRAGPAIFTGLPGLVLSVNVPRWHTTWTATHVEVRRIADKELTVPLPGKICTPTAYDSLIRLRAYSGPPLEKTTYYDPMVNLQVQSDAPSFDKWAWLFSL